MDEAGLAIAEPRDSDDSDSDSDDEDDPSPLVPIAFVLAGSLAVLVPGERRVTSWSLTLRLLTSALIGVVGTCNWELRRDLRDWGLQILPLSGLFACAMAMDQHAAADAAMTGCAVYFFRVMTSDDKTGHRISIATCILIAGACLHGDLLRGATASLIFAVVLVGLTTDDRKVLPLTASFSATTCFFLFCYSAIFTKFGPFSVLGVVNTIVVPGLLDVVRIYLLVRYSALTLCFSEAGMACIQILLLKQFKNTVHIEAIATILAGIVTFVLVSFVRPRRPNVKVTARYTVTFGERTPFHHPFLLHGDGGVRQLQIDDFPPVDEAPVLPSGVSNYLEIPDSYQEDRIAECRHGDP